MIDLQIHTNPNQKEHTTMHTTRWRAPLALGLALALMGAACGSDDESPETGGSEDVEAVEGETIRFAPQQFAESETLTEVYAQYLEAKGFDVEVQPSSGFRDIVYPGLTNGDLDVIIDYAGSAASFLDATASDDADETYEALTTALEAEDLVAYEDSEAEDANAVVALKSWAEDNDVTTISDLKDVEGGVTLGASEDCRERENCLIGFEDPEIYGLTFEAFTALEYGPPLTAALEADEVQVAYYQTTAPDIASGKFVVLEDDKGLLASDNIVPVLRKEVADAYGDVLADAMNELSALITTDDLIDWNVSTDIDKDESADVATAWLESKNLL
ncbi:MAG: ABC transporter substrate-binding protein [Acidimicrobiales bacterium]